MRNVHQMQRSTGSQGWVWVQMKNTIALQQLHPWHLFWCVLTVVDPVRRPTNQPSEVVSREKQPRDMRHHSTEHPNLYDTTVGKSRHPKRQLHQHELIPARTWTLSTPYVSINVVVNSMSNWTRSSIIDRIRLKGLARSGGDRRVVWNMHRADDTMMESGSQAAIPRPKALKCTVWGAGTPGHNAPCWSCQGNQMPSKCYRKCSN